MGRGAAAAGAGAGAAGAGAACSGGRPSSTAASSSGSGDGWSNRKETWPKSRSARMICSNETLPATNESCDSASLERSSEDAAPLLMSSAARRCSTVMRWSGRRSTPSSATLLMTSSAWAVLPVRRCLTSARALSSPLMPSNSRACSTVTREPNDVMSWSSRFVPSRRLPPDARPMRRSTSGETSTPSSCAMPVSRSVMSCMAMRWKSNRWHREMMVGGRRSGSVVARTNTLWGGGSSSVFRNALKASLVSAWASSMM